MADSIGTAYVQIIPSAKGISGKIQSAISPEAQAAGEKAGQKISTAMGSRISSLGKTLMKSGAIASAVSVPIIAGLKKAMDAYEVQATAETKLTTIYRDRLHVTEASAKATMKLASALQKEGVIGDEVTISGAQQIATFAKYPSTVDKLLPAMDNLIAQQKGLNATTDDARNVANLMGKALQGQTGALRRVGITFTDAQEKVLKYGNEEERAAMLAEVINDNVGDMNKELAKTPAGKMQQLKNSLGDMAESLGAVLAPVLQKVAAWISEKIVPKVEAFIAFLERHPIIAKIVVAITALLAVGGPLLIFIGAITSAVGALIPVIMAVSLPILAIVAAIAAVIAVVVLIKKHWQKIKGFLLNCWNAIKAAAQRIWNGIKNVIMAAVRAVTGFIKRVWNGVKNFLKACWNGIKSIAKTIWAGTGEVVKNGVVKTILFIREKWTAFKNWISNLWTNIKTRASNAWNNIRGGIVGAANKIKNGVGEKFSNMKTNISTTFGKVKDAMLKPFRAARDAIKKVVDKIKGFFKFKWSWPKLKLPHFKISPKGWKFKDLFKGSVPSLSIEWYAKGAIFRKPTLLGNNGVGEAGPEAVLPLSTLWTQMMNFADSIVDGVGMQYAAAQGAGGDITVQLYAYPNGPKMDEWIVKSYDRGKRRLG